MKKPFTTPEFIEKAVAVHGYRYDYSLVKYKYSHIKVKIICPVHGVFEQTPNRHLAGQGCIACSGNKVPTTTEYIEKAHTVHGYRYDYSLVKYKHSHKKVKIVCPIHGVFEQTPTKHLQGRGCPACSYTKVPTTTEYIEKAHTVHGYRYDYSLVEYAGARTKVKIICPVHGVFEQIADSHLKGSGCQICALQRNKSEQAVAAVIAELIKDTEYTLTQQYMHKTLRNKRKLQIDFALFRKDSDTPVLLIEHQGGQHFYPVEYFGGVPSWIRSLHRDELKVKWAGAHKIPLIMTFFNDDDDGVRDKVSRALSLIERGRSQDTVGTDFYSSGGKLNKTAIIGDMVRGVMSIFENYVPDYDGDDETGVVADYFYKVIGDRLITDGLQQIVNGEDDGSGFNEFMDKMKNALDLLKSLESAL